MDPFSIAMIVFAAISVITNVAGGIYTNIKEKKNYEDMKTYNSPVEQMKRFEEAGLNPNLAVGQPNTVSQAPQVSNPAESLVNLPNMLNQAYGTSDLVRSRKANEELRRQDLQIKRMSNDIKLKTANQALAKGDIQLAMAALNYDTAVQSQPAVLQKIFADAGLSSSKADMAAIDLASYDTYRDAVVQNAVAGAGKTAAERDWLVEQKPALEWYKARTSRSSAEQAHEDRKQQMRLMDKFKSMDVRQRDKEYRLAERRYDLAVRAQKWDEAHYWMNVMVAAAGAGVKTLGRMYGVPVQ